jgi:orotate phosphoribosyltransferase
VSGVGTTASFVREHSPIAESPLAERIKRLGVHRDDETLISSSGGLQEWLIDLRRVFLDSGALEEFAAAFWARFKDHAPFQVAGMETAAIPLLSAILLSCPKERAPLNGLIIRKERKTTGLGRAIEGEVTQAPIVLIDDILNSGESAEKARVVLEAVGRKIDEMFVVIDYRSSRGMDWRKSHGIAMHSLFTLAEFGLALHKDAPPRRRHYRELWRAAVPGGFPFYVVPKSTPLLVGDVIYRGCDAGKMHAFAAETGAILWEYQATARRCARASGHRPPITTGAFISGPITASSIASTQRREPKFGRNPSANGSAPRRSSSPSMGSSISASNMSGPGRKGMSARSTCAAARRSGNGSPRNTSTARLPIGAAATSSSGARRTMRWRRSEPNPARSNGCSRHGAR